MAELSVIWLRVAAALYSVGLAHSLLAITQRRDNLFRYALNAARAGVLFHFVSIIEQGLVTGRCPVNTTYEILSMGALIMTALFLAVQWRYKVDSFAVILFPLVFVITLVATMATPVYHWSNPAIRSAWLTTHVVLVLLGYAALLLTAIAAIMYLMQERELKRKVPRQSYYRLPPLGTLDELVSRFMAAGFVFITLATIAGSTWAFIEIGTTWISDPRVTVSFLTWGICLAMIFLRFTAGWRGRKAALMAITALCGSAITWVTHRGILNLTQ